MASERVFVPESSSDPSLVLSAAIWGNFPFATAYSAPWRAHFEYENFREFPMPATNQTTEAGRWSIFLSDGATITDPAIADHSAAKFLSDGDNEAAVLCRKNAGIRITKNSGRIVAYESRLKVSTISDSKNGLFVGLFEPLTPTATSHIGDDGAMVDKNFIGFHRLEGDGDKIDIVYKADGQTQQSFADALTLVADTFVRVGFLFDGKQTLKFFLDGALYSTATLDATDLDAATFPDDINLAPAIVGAKNATGSTPGDNTINWSAFGYTRGVADLFS